MTFAPGTSPSPTDLTTVASAYNWAKGGQAPNVSAQANLQACISAASIQFLRLTGRGPQNWKTATKSPFVQPVDYVETYSGSGGDELFLRNSPINSVASVSLFGSASLQPSANGSGTGYQIGGNSLIISGGFTIGAPIGFNFGTRYSGICGGRGWPRGSNNIQVSYNAGYATQSVVGELQTIPSTGALTITAGSIEGGYNWLADGGVSFFSNGSPLVASIIAPAVGQYYLQSPGVYLFNVADAGKQVLLNYTAAGTPPDIVLAINQMVALNFTRRNWIGVRSVGMKDVGTTSYTMELDPSILKVIDLYSRNNRNC